MARQKSIECEVITMIFARLMNSSMRAWRFRLEVALAGGRGLDRAHKASSRCTDKFNMALN
jgi:hypothetical protein